MIQITPPIHFSHSNQEGYLLKYQNYYEESQHNDSLHIISKTNGTALETEQEGSCVLIQ